MAGTSTAITVSTATMTRMTTHTRLAVLMSAMATVRSSRNGASEPSRIVYSTAF
jgi:hypothetical protein